MRKNIFSGGKKQLSDDQADLQAEIVGLQKMLDQYGDIEQLLEESEHRFKRMFSLTHDGIVIYEKETGIIIDVNVRLVRQLGYKRKETIGRSVLEFIAPEQVESVKERLDENLPDIYKLFIFSKSGKKIEFEVCSRSCKYKKRIVKMAAICDISFHQQYEKRIKESEELFRSLSENMDDSIILVEKEKIIYANPSTEHVLGRVSETDRLKNVFSHVHSDDRHAVHAYIREINLGKQVDPCQFRIAIENDQYRWLWSRVFPVAPSGLQNSRLIVLTSDITEMRQKERNQLQLEVSAKNAEEKYKVLTALLPEIIIETDQEGRLKYANLKAIETFEYGSDFYVQNLHFLELIHKDDRAEVRKACAGVVNGVHISEAEYTAVTKSGRKIPIMLHVSPIFSNGQFMGLSIAMFDISKQKYAERNALNYQENMMLLSNSALKFLSSSDEDDIYIFIGKTLSKIVPKSVVTVFSLDQSNNHFFVRYISGIVPYVDRIIKILGDVPESFPIDIPQSFREKYLSKKTLVHLNDLNEAVQSEEAMNICARIQQILGIQEFHIMGLSREGKTYGGLMIATKEATEKVDIRLVETFVYQAGIALNRKQLENELIHAKLVAEESDWLKSAFLANMSHEVRTPLNGILGLAQLLLEEDLPSNLRNDYARMIVESGSSLLTLIEDIMDISKIEAKQMKIKYQPFGLNAMVDQLYSLFIANPLYFQKNQDFLFRTIKPEKDVKLISDPDRIQQIFINLIGNALKFTQKGFVEFGYQLDKKRVLFFVNDSGIGVPDDKRKTIFERFTQVDNTMARKYSGSGLGLAISKGLVELLGGEIWSETNVMNGSSFYFTIPYAPASELPSEDLKPVESVTAKYNWESRTILVVEDDRINFKVIEAMLKNTKVNIIHADNGLQAIEYVNLNPEIELILMDMHLPEMSGLEATQIILRNRPGVPIIAQTANAMYEDKYRCLEIGCVDYISKPITMNNLYTTIAKYLPDDRYTRTLV